MREKRAMRAAVIAAAVLLPIGAAALCAPAAQAASPHTATCSYHGKSDFNGDGHADVVVMQPNETTSKDSIFGEGKGAIRVLYGSASGVSKTGNMYIDGSGIADAHAAADDDLFGVSTASGDFNGDGCADLAIAAVDATAGKTDEDPPVMRGQIIVLYGSPAGLSLTNSAVINDFDIPGSDADSSFIGVAMAAGDFNGDGHDDLAVGSPVNFASPDMRGGIGVLYGAPAGLSAAGSAFITQASSGVVGAAEPGDGFGAALAAGDFNGDGKCDLAVGAPDQSVGSVDDAGTVTVLLGGTSGITGTGSQQWSKASSGVPGTATEGDEFGTALAAGKITSSAHADLVVGTPYANVGSVSEAGTVTLIKGASTGLTGSGSAYYDQNSAGVPGTAEKYDYFGQSVAVGDFNGDGHGDVAVGVPGEDIGSKSNAGEVNVLNGNSSGLTAPGAQGWYQDSPGISGGSEAHDNFGFSVAAPSIVSSGHADLVVGVPYEDTGSTTNNGMINVILGTAGKGLTSTGNQGIDETGLVNGAKSLGEMGMSLINLN